MPFLRAGGVRLEYESRGSPGSGPPLILLHEGLGSVAAWRGFPEALAGSTGRAVFVYSRRGYGLSDPLPGPLTPSFMHDEARLLPAVLQAAGISDPVLIGHSDGASIALIHAAAPAAPAPDTPARALVLLAPHVFVEEETLAGIREVSTRYHAGDFGARWRRTQGEHADRTFAAWTEVWLSPAFRDWNIEAGLPRIRCPVLAIQGEDDQYGTTRQLGAIRAGVGGAVDTLLLPSCGHAPQRDRPKETLEAIRRFVASATPAA